MLRGNQLAEITVPGIHTQVYPSIRNCFPDLEVSILDCGAGTGAWVERLRSAGYRNITAVDRDGSRYGGFAPLQVIDLNDNFSESLAGQFDVITAIEVIEHLENPVHFLRQARKLLKPTGTLVLTTPNVEGMPGRLKFLLSGNLRHFDRHGDPTHISPILSSLLSKLAAQVDLRVVQRLPIIPMWEERRWWVRALCRMIAPLVSGPVYGESHLFFLRPQLGHDPVCAPY